MLGIFRREYTINETSIGHFLWKYCIYNKIKIRDFRWVTERIQSPIQNLESIENKKENGRKIHTFCRKSFKDSKTVFVFILA